MAYRSSKAVREGKATEVCFDTPLVFDIKPHHKPGDPVIYTYQEIQAIAQAAIDLGFDERAIVVRRSNYGVFGAGRPRTWGVVVDVNRVVPFNTNETYKPLSVHWLGNNESTKHNPEDLWLIHESIKMSEAEDRARRQE